MYNYCITAYVLVYVQEHSWNRGWHNYSLSSFNCDSNLIISCVTELWPRWWMYIELFHIGPNQFLAFLLQTENLFPRYLSSNYSLVFAGLALWVNVLYFMLTFMYAWISFCILKCALFLVTNIVTQSMYMLLLSYIPKMSNIIMSSNKSTNIFFKIKTTMNKMQKC